MERIRNKGKSILLSQLADKVENTEPDSPVGPRSVNVAPMSITPNPIPFRQPQPSIVNVAPVNKPIEYENELIVEEDEDIFYVNSRTERIVVKSGLCNDDDIDKLKLSKCERLVELVVGDNCLQYLSGLKLSGLKCLERVEIGMGCMCKSEGGVFEVSGCERLRSVEIGGGSCVNWSSFSLKDCEVEEVRIGDGSFANCESRVFEVNGCERLKSVMIGSGCFVNWKLFTLKDCGVIEVRIGNGCFVNCESIVFES